MYSCLVAAFFGCPNPYVQLYETCDGIVVHDISKGYMHYLDEDTSITTLYFNEVVVRLGEDKKEVLHTYSTSFFEVEGWFCKVKLNKNQRGIDESEHRPEFLTNR